MMRRSDSNRWKTVVVVFAIGGAVGLALVRSRRVVLAPGRAKTAPGATTTTGGDRESGPRASAHGSSLTSSRHRNPGATAPSAPAFRTADALARQAAAVYTEEGTGGDSSETAHSLVPSASEAAAGTVEARPEESGPATQVETVGQPADPFAAAGAEDRLVAERTSAEGSAGIAHPGTVAAGLGEPPSRDRGEDPWGEDAPLGAAGRGPGAPRGEGFGSDSAEALFSGDVGTAPAQDEALSPRVEALLPEGVHVEAFAAVGTNRDDDAGPDAGTAAGGAEAGEAAVGADDAMLGLASAQAIGHGVAPIASSGGEEPEPSLAELQDEARDMVLGTGAGTARTEVESDSGGRTAQGGRGGAASTPAEGFVPTGAVTGGSRECPDGYPIKGNADSRIYHVPGSASYEQTVPEFCFATAEDAENAGYRARKR